MSDESMKVEPEETPASDESGETVTLPKAEVDALRAKVEEYLNMAQRVQADFVNYQKRVVRDREESSRYLVERLVAELLPALDTFALGLRGPVDAGNFEGFVKGMQLAEREIFRKLEAQGLKRIAASGEFDPAVQEAVVQVPTRDAAPGTVVAELRPGYMWNGKVLRAAQVSVAVAPVDNSRT